MRKTILLGVVLLMFAVSVFAVPRVAQDRVQQANQIMLENRDSKPADLPLLEEVPGLANAYTRVDDPVAKEQISLAMVRFQKNYNYAYHNYQVEPYGDIMHVIAQNRVRFLGIPITYEDRLVIDDQGEILQERLHFVGKIIRFFGGKR